MYDLLHNFFSLCRIDWTAVFTAFLAIIAFWQLRKINKTSSGDFLHRLKIDLLNDKSSLFFSIIDKNCLIFIKPEKDGIPYFKIILDDVNDGTIKNELVRKIKKIREGSYIVDSLEIDELLLGHIEDLGILEQKRILDIQIIYEAFDSYIEICWKNQSINEYVGYLRKTEGWDLYDKAEDIYNKCQTFGEKKARKRNTFRKPKTENRKPC
jgi:hypothetical protein